MKSLFKAAVALALFCVAAVAFAGQAALSWNKSVSTNVAGYYAYWSTTSGQYNTTNRVKLGDVTTTIIPNLVGGTTYFFVVTAFATNADGVIAESGYSNEATARVPLALPVTPLPASGVTATGQP